MKLDLIIAKLSSTGQDQLPGDTAHMEMTPYKKGLTVQPQSPKLSAVMILIYEKEGESEILLLKRAEYGGVHSAQISFPGGKKDESDPDLSYTAIRELEEETGISQDNFELYHSLSPMFIPPSNFLVHPFVAICKQVPQVKLNERESQYFFGGKISELLHDESLKKTNIKASYGTLKDVPYFNLNNEIIWGATAAILNELKWILKQ